MRRAFHIAGLLLAVRFTCSFHPVSIAYQADGLHKFGRILFLGRLRGSGA
jgi:hypothetical protein